MTLLPVALVCCRAADPKPKLHSPGASGSPGVSPVQPSVSPGRAREQAVEVIEQFAHSEHEQFRAHAVEAASLAPKRFSDIIRAGLLDTNPGVRAVALMAVGREKLTSMKELVRPLARDNSSHVRASAVYALSRLGDSVDQTPLATILLTDESPWASRHAAYVLGEMGNITAMPLLQNAAATRTLELPPAQQHVFQLMVSEALVKLGDENQRASIRAALYPATPGELEVAALAAQAIGETKDRSAVGQLISLDSYRDSGGNPYPAEVRLAAASALGRLGLDAGVPIADQFLNSKVPLQRAQAADALGHVGKAAVLGRLVPMLEDTDGSVRIAAAAAILRCSK
jgi:HEAT repeat protein